MAFPRDLIPHKLPRTACRLTSYNVLYKNKARAQVLLLMDNISAVHKQNGTVNLPHVVLPSQNNLWDWCLTHNILVSAQYIPGVQNVEADRESRNRPFCLPTLLSTRSVCELATRPTGSSNRCVHPRQGDFSRVCLPSIRPDRPMPPTNAESTSVTHGVSSTRLAAQPWYPLLLDLCIDVPVLIPIQEDLLTQGTRLHPIKHLVGWLM